MKLKRKAAALPLIALLAIGGCSSAGGDKAESQSDGAAPVEAAPEEVTVACTVFDDWCQAATQAFTEKTGIPASYVNMGTGEAITRIKATGDEPESDVLMGGPSENYIAAKDDGLLEPYAVEVIPDEYKDPDNYWTGIYVGALGFCSNKAVLDELGLEIPTSWNDLLDPRYKGQIGISHPATAGTGYNILWANYVLNGKDDQALLDFWKKFDANISQYTAKGGASGPMAGRGELATALIFAHDCPKWINEGMTDLVLSSPKEGVGFEVGGIALLKNAPDPAAGKAFIDFIATAEAQEIMATVGSYQTPTNPDAKVSDDSPKLEDFTLVEYDAGEAAAEKPRLVELFETEIEAPPADE